MYSGNSAVIVMQAAEDGFTDDLAIRLNRPMYRRILLKRHVRSADVVIFIDVFVQHAMQMSFIKNNHVVQTLSAQRADDAFCNRILPWRTIKKLIQR